MSRETVKATLETRLKEIEQELVAYRDLVAEAERIRAMLAEVYTEPSRVVQLFPEGDARGRVITAGATPRRTSSQHRFKPNPNSKTAKICKESARILTQTSDGQLPFLNAYHQVPRTVFGTIKHPREYMRTALSRAGARFGVGFDGKVLYLLAGAQKKAPGVSAGG